MNLRSRIVLAVATVFAGVSLLAGGLMLARAEESLWRAFDRSIQTRANWLLSLVGTDPVVVPLPAETEQMRLVYEAYGHSRELFRSPRPSEGQAFSYRTVTVRSDAGQLPEGRVWLSLSVPDTSLRQDISRLRWVFGLGWLLSLVLAGGAAYGVAGLLLKPIQTIVRQAGTISNATMIDPIPLPKTHDELYQLTDALNRMLARVRESAELQRNFFGAAAHELRTPLTIMKTGLEVTLSSGRVDTLMMNFLTGQLADIDRLTRLLDEFLTLSRPDDSPQPIRASLVSVPELMTRCLTQLTPLAADYGVTTGVTLPDETLPPLLTDAVKLEQILLNLLENAIKYARPGTLVRVEMACSARWVIRVLNETSRENGPTLDLLQPYFRADPLRDGHGLGLWISHRLTTLLGGQLHLRWQDFTFISELTLPVSFNDSSLSQ